MAHRIPGIIQIGGTITDPEVIAALLSMIESDGAGFEFGEATSMVDILDEMESTSEGEYGDTLELRDERAASGEFPDTQEACIDHNIPYDRQCEGEYAWWRPGMAHEEVRLADTDCNIIVPLDELRLALDQGESLQSIVDRNTPPNLPAFRMICSRKQVEAFLESE